MHAGCCGAAASPSCKLELKRTSASQGTEEADEEGEAIHLGPYKTWFAWAPSAVLDYGGYLDEPAQASDVCACRMLLLRVAPRVGVVLLFELLETCFT